jgi:hypothetical protein
LENINHISAVEGRARVAAGTIQDSRRFAKPGLGLKSRRDYPELVTISPEADAGVGPGRNDAKGLC